MTSSAHRLMASRPAPLRFRVGAPEHDTDHQQGRDQTRFSITPRPRPTKAAILRSPTSAGALLCVPTHELLGMGATATRPNTAAVGSIASLDQQRAPIGAMCRTCGSNCVMLGSLGSCVGCIVSLGGSPAGVEVTAHRPLDLRADKADVPGTCQRISAT